MIRIVNLRNYKLSKDEVLIKVDRSTAVGNPYPMIHEGQRDEVCDDYKKYFYIIINTYRNTDTKIDTKDLNFLKYIGYIVNTAKKHDVALGCWCAPRRCHAETIKEFVESVI